MRGGAPSLQEVNWSGGCDGVDGYQEETLVSGVVRMWGQMVRIYAKLCKPLFCIYNSAWFLLVCLGLVANSCIADSAVLISGAPQGGGVGQDRNVM